VFKIQKLFIALACCLFMCLSHAQADTFFSQFQSQGINQAQVMNAPQRRSGGITIYNSSPKNYYTYNNTNYDFNFSYNPTYWTNVNYIYNNYHSNYNSNDYRCPYASAQHGYDYGYSAGYAASYVICFDETFYDDCFNGGDWDYPTPGTGTCQPVLIDGNYTIGHGSNCTIDCPTRACPTGYTGNIQGRFQNGTCTYSDLSTCTRTTNIVCPTIPAPNCGINGLLDTEEYTYTSGGQSLTCERPVCRVNPGPRVCTQDARMCADGSSVGRDPNNNCEFRPCPVTPTPTTCTQTCAAGTVNAGQQVTGTLQNGTCVIPANACGGTVPQPTTCTSTCPVGTANAGQQVTGNLVNGQCIVAPNSCGGTTPTTCSFTCPVGTSNAGQQVSGNLVNGQCVPVAPGSCGTIVPPAMSTVFRPTAISSVFNNNAIGIGNTSLNQNDFRIRAGI
jgi:hypothetical protein